MPEELKHLSEFSTFDDIIGQLQRMAREQLLAYRIGVGQVLLDGLFGGDAAAYASRDPNKELRFARFFAEREAELRRFGLTDRMSRHCISCYAVFRTLPPAVREQLFWSQVQQLVRVHDVGMRAQLAVAAVQQQWSVEQLKNAVSAVNAGLPLDGDAEVAGLQAPDAPPARSIAPGRLVNRAEKWAGDLEQWSEQWFSGDTSRLRPAQRERLAAAVAAARGRLIELEARLAQ